MGGLFETGVCVDFDEIDVERFIDDEIVAEYFKAVLSVFWVNFVFDRTHGAGHLGFDFAEDHFFKFFVGEMKIFLRLVNDTLKSIKKYSVFDLQWHR